MTKYDFKIKRTVFRSGKFRGKRDFQRFEKSFLKRKKSETRLRNLIIMIIIVFLTVVMMFSVRILSVTDGSEQQELKPVLSNRNSITSLTHFKSVALLYLPSHHSGAMLSNTNCLIYCDLKPHNEPYCIMRVKFTNTHQIL
jgi:hypothetical protein